MSVTRLVSSPAALKQSQASGHDPSLGAFPPNMLAKKGIKERPAWPPASPATSPAIASPWGFLPFFCVAGNGNALQVKPPPPPASFGSLGVLRPRRAKRRAVLSCRGEGGSRLCSNWMKSLFSVFRAAGLLDRWFQRMRGATFYSLRRTSAPCAGAASLCLQLSPVTPAAAAAEGLQCEGQGSAG